MNKKAVAGLCSIAVLTSMGLSACGSDSSGGGDGVTEISVWSGFTENDGTVVQNLADEFNQSQDEYKVVVEKNPWNVINDKLLSALSAGNGPDVITYQPDGARGFADQGAFLPVDDFYADQANETDVYRANVVADGEIDGVHYGVPMGHAPYSVYFNTAIFEEAGIGEDQYPTSWDELAELAQRLTVDEDGDGTPERYGIALADKDAGYLPTFLQAAGTDLVVDGKANLTSEPSRQALTFWRDNVYAEQASPSNLSLVDAQNLFIGGKAAMFLIGPWIVETASSKGVETGTFEFPQGPEQQVTTVAANYWYVTSQVNGDDAKKQGAYAWMRFFNSRENQLTWAIEANYPPNRTDITADDLADNALIAQISPYMDHTKILLGSVPTGFADVQSELNALGPKISASSGDITAILEESNRKIQSLIEQ